MTPSIQRIASGRPARARSARASQIGRRAFAHALLLIALLAAQLGAFTHSLSHLANAGAEPALSFADDTGPSEQSGAKHKADHACPLCSAFAGVAAALVDHGERFESAEPAYALRARDARFATAHTSFCFLSRAPPAGAV